MKHPIYTNNNGFINLSTDRGSISVWSDNFFEWLYTIHPKYSDYIIFLEDEERLKETLADMIIKTQLFTGSARELVSSIFELQLPDIHKILIADLETMFNADPAAKTIEEVLLAYPGFYAITIHRIAHALYNMDIPVIPRLLSEYSHSKTGIDIHPGARIGKRFHIDHGTGIVIGETCEIGNDVKIYQGVTIGALSVNRQCADTKRHPTIGDRVTIYSNATILGGNTIIGEDSVIGGNVWITKSVPPKSMVFHKSEVTIKNNNTFPEALTYSI